MGSEWFFHVDEWFGKFGPALFYFKIIPETGQIITRHVRRIKDLFYYLSVFLSHYGIFRRFYIRVIWCASPAESPVNPLLSAICISSNDRK